MTSKDLKDLLQTMATEGTDRVEVDERELIPRIRSRRRRRAGLAAAVSASTAVVIAAAAFAVLPGGDQKQPPVAGPATTAPVLPTVTLSPGSVREFACGGSFNASLAGDPSLRFDLETPVATRAADGQGLWVDFKLTNTSDKALDLFSTPYGPLNVVVKDGIVVAARLGEAQPGKAWPLTPGQSVAMKTALDGYRCTSDGSQGSELLAPGTYQLYAFKDFSQTTAAGRDKVVAAGGPWTFEVK